MSAGRGTLNAAIRRVEDRRAERAIRRCRSCGRQLFGRANVCRSRRCPEYGPVWAGDQRQKLFRNLETLPGDILLSAVTAPGAELLPWDSRAMRRPWRTSALRQAWMSREQGRGARVERVGGGSLATASQACLSGCRQAARTGLGVLGGARVGDAGAWRLARSSGARLRNSATEGRRSMLSRTSG